MQRTDINFMTFSEAIFWFFWTFFAHQLFIATRLQHGRASLESVRWKEKKARAWAAAPRFYIEHVPRVCNSGARRLHACHCETSSASVYARRPAGQIVTGTVRGRVISDPAASRSVTGRRARTTNVTAHRAV